MMRDKEMRVLYHDPKAAEALGSAAMNRHQDKSYKEQHSMGPTGSEVQSIIIKVGTWQHPGRHGAGGAESSTSSCVGC